MASISPSLQVEVNGTEHPFPSSEQMQVSLLVKQLRVNFIKGERVTLRAFAVSSVGTSDPVSADVIVPCELLYVYDIHNPCRAYWWVVSVYVGIVNIFILWWYVWIMCGVIYSCGLLLIAVPPNVTAPHTELSTTNIPVCCAGVQLNLAG